MKATIYIKNIVYCISIFCVLFPSCKKFVDIPAPTDQIVSPLPFDNDATATATVTGIYSEMMRNAQQFSSSLITLYAGMSADELYYYSPSFRDEFVKNNITLANHSNLTAYFWQPAYKFIYAANLVLEQLNISTKLSAEVKDRLKGEARFIRAFCYFHLSNLFGAVPLALTSDYNITASLPRTSVDSINTQIITDLKEAQRLIPDQYPTLERVRPNKWTATALLARVHLYVKDWSNAELQAGEIINSGMYSLPGNLNIVFQKASGEAIWQLRPVNPSLNTMEGNSILPGSPNAQPTYLVKSELLNSFEMNDQRKTSWIASRTYLGQTVYYPYKYKVFGNNAPLTEYYVVFRLAEQYLIRAEARAMQNKISESQADINLIRNRSGLGNTSANSQPDLLLAIEQERRTEFFAEWGHRWYDLKRTGKADPILSILKPTTWQPTDVLWPIPVDQIKLNSALTQNAGY